MDNKVETARNYGIRNSVNMMSTDAPRKPGIKSAVQQAQEEIDNVRRSIDELEKRLSSILGNSRTEESIKPEQISELSSDRILDSMMVLSKSINLAHHSISEIMERLEL